MWTRRTLLALAVPAPEPEEIRLTLNRPQAMEARWPSGVDAPASPGSLWKPFLAALWTPTPPHFLCDGSRCWLGRRHGRLDLAAALAVSCNQYFHQLAAALSQPLSGLSRFGLPVPVERDWTRWQATPRALALAYAELLARRDQHPHVLAGLRAAALHGTARSLGRGYLAKTGTGPSTRFAGDGWVVAAAPADLPRSLILYREFGVTGTQAAANLARTLRERPLP